MVSYLLFAQGKNNGILKKVFKEDTICRNGEVEMEMNMPEDVEYIINTLEEAGYEAYAVGGCVRDVILGRKPQDWDITTSAKPEQVKSLFGRTLDTGIAHGTVTVMRNRVGYEVTTYRIDGEYEDNRHPKSVEFTDNLILDLERRDFTINAMAYNKKRGLVDAFDGMGDMERKVIRCVGDAGARFDEDALRMLRAVRFSGQLCFEIEAGTKEAIVQRARHLENISAERIRVELSKLLVAKDAGQIREAYKTGMTGVFLPEIDVMMEWEQKNSHHIYTVGEHSVRSVEVMNYFFGKYNGKWDCTVIPQEAVLSAREFAKDLNEKQHRILCLTMLLHDIGKTSCMQVDENGIGHFFGHPKLSEEQGKKIMKRLTFDNDTIHTVRRLIRWHDYRFGESERKMRQAMAKIGPDLMPLLFLVQLSDVMAQNPETIPSKTEKIKNSIRLWENVEASKAALSIKQLKITGNDVMALGIKPGPYLGQILKEALEWVLEEPERNEKETLLEWVKSRKSEE